MSNRDAFRDRHVRFAALLSVETDTYNGSRTVLG